MKKDIDHSNHHSFHYESVQFKPGYWIDEDDNTITLQLNAVDSLHGESGTLWAMAHVSFVLTHAQLKALSAVVNEAIIKTLPKPEIDDLVRNIEESEANA